MKKTINNFNKLSNILNKNQKLYVVLLVILFVFVALLETLSLGLILPLVYILLNQDSETFFFVKKIYSIFFNNLNNSKIIIISLLIVSILYVFKAFVYAIVIRINLRITANISLELTDNLYKSYLGESYIFHLNENTSKLTRNILGEVHNYCSIISLLTQFIGEILMVIFVSIMLVFIEPYLVITIITILSLIAGTYYLLFSKLIENWGLIRQKMDFLRIKYINEGFSLIKEVKIYKLENIFAKKHYAAYESSIKTDVNINFLTSLSKPILETISILIFMTFLSYLVIFNSENSNLSIHIPFIALLGASTFKLLPAIQGMSQRLQHIKYISPSIDAVYDNLKDLKITNLEFNNNKTLNFNDKIEIKNLNFSYPNKEEIIKNINFNINKNDIFGIIGRSGSGKTTLLNLLMGIFRPTSGKIICDGEDINNNISLWYENISYVSQNIVLFDDTIKNNIIFGKKYDKEKFYDVINKSQLNNLINKLPYKENTEFGERGIRISGGEKQRIAIARALYRNSKIIFLDEATNSLDNKTENEFIDTIKELNNEITFVIVAHNNKMIDICNKKISIENIYE